MIDLALDNRVMLDNDLDLAIQELDMLFNTTCTELIGYPDYGISIETFLWTLTPTTSELKKYINNQIKEYCVFANMFKVNVDVEFYQGKFRSIYLVMITLETPNGDMITRKYQYQ